MAGGSYWGRTATRRMGRRRVLALGGIVAAGGAIAAACGGGSSKEASGSSQPTGAAGTGTQAAAGGTKAPTGKITVVLAGLGTQDYDPAHDKNSGEVLVNAHVGEALAIMGPDKNVYVPALAPKWETAPDGLSWTFTIRKDAKFHDLTPVTPEDVKYSFERFTDPASKPVSGARLSQLLDGITVNGDQVTMKLKRPESYLIAQVAQCQITPKAAVEKAGDAFGQHPIGAGPFRFVSATKDSEVVLEAFDQHYRKVPAFKTLTLKIVPEVTTRLAALQSGEADVMLGVFGPAIPSIEGSGRFKLNQVESTSMNGIVFADLVGPDTYQGSRWADVRMRQAVAHAIDLNQIVEKIYFKKAVAVAIPWAVPGIPGTDASLKPYPYDPKKAKDLMAAAGHGDGFEIQIYTYDSAAISGNVDVAQAVGGYLEKVGIKNTVNPVEYATYLANQRAKKWAGSGALMVSVQGGRGGESFQPSLSQEGSTPYAYAPELEKMANQAEAATSDKERDQITLDLSRKLYEQLPNVPLISPNYMEGLGERIKGWTPRVRAGFELGMEYIELKG
jgi:peptide/nickel transport system substrate-binding protein